MRNIGTILEWKFPGKEEQRGYQVRSISDEDGNPVDSYISIWDEGIMGRAEPTQGELESWALDAAKWTKKRELRKAADAETEQVFTLDGEYMESEFINMLLRVAQSSDGQPKGGDVARVNAVKAIDLKLRGGGGGGVGKLDEVNAATTVGQVEGITW